MSHEQKALIFSQHNQAYECKYFTFIRIKLERVILIELHILFEMLVLKNECPVDRIHDEGCLFSFNFY